MSIKWNSIRLGGPAHGIMAKTIHKTMPGDGGLGVGVGSNAGVKFSEPPVWYALIEFIIMIGFHKPPIVVITPPPIGI